MPRLVLQSFCTCSSSHTQAVLQAHSLASNPQVLVATPQQLLPVLRSGTLDTGMSHSHALQHGSAAADAPPFTVSDPSLTTHTQHTLRLLSPQSQPQSISCLRAEQRAAAQAVSCM